MIITDVLPKCNAFVAAWLPGTEGLGISDVLFGDYDFKGKLKHTWPSSMLQIPINSGDGKTGLFPYGYGLKMAP
jgi:beta-glucosidase